MLHVLNEQQGSGPQFLGKTGTSVRSVGDESKTCRTMMGSPLRGIELTNLDSLRRTYQVKMKKCGLM
jgi:hypothetical protein